MFVYHKQNVLKLLEPFLCLHTMYTARGTLRKQCTVNNPPQLARSICFELFIKLGNVLQHYIINIVILVLAAAYPPALLLLICKHQETNVKPFVWNMNKWI